MTLDRALFAVLFLAAGCHRPQPRPATAMDYCQQLGTKYFEGKTECMAVTDEALLAAMHAIELAKLMKRVPDPKVPGTDKLIDIGWIAYEQKIDRASLGGLMQAMGQQFLAAARLEASNEEALVSVYVARGEISADRFDALQKEVTALAPKG